jgi:hypothetical protein
MYSMPRSSRLDALEIYVNIGGQGKYRGRVNIGDVLPAGLILQIEPKYFGAINTCPANAG